MQYEVRKVCPSFYILNIEIRTSINIFSTRLCKYKGWHQSISFPTSTLGLWEANLWFPDQLSVWNIAKLCITTYSFALRTLLLLMSMKEAQTFPLFDLRRTYITPSVYESFFTVVSNLSMYIEHRPTFDQSKGVLCWTCYFIGPGPCMFEVANKKKHNL